MAVLASRWGGCAVVRGNGRLFGFRLTGFSLFRSSGVRCSGEGDLACPALHLGGRSLPVILVVKWLRWVVLRVWRCHIVAFPLCRIRWAPVSFATTEAAVEFSYAGWWWYLAQFGLWKCGQGFKGCRLWHLDGPSRCSLSSKLLYSALPCIAPREGWCFRLELCLCSFSLLCLWLAPEMVYFSLECCLHRFSKASGVVAALGCSRWSPMWHAWLCSHPSIAQDLLNLCGGAAFLLFAGLEASGWC